MNEILLKIWHRRLKQPFRLHYETFGSGPQAVLLLHGVASHGTFWQPLINLLDQNHYRVVVPDLLGHGRSPRPGFVEYSTDDQAEAMLALSKRLKLTNVIVVGHSMGSLVAMRLANRQPKLVTRLLLFEPPLFSDMPEFRTGRRRQQFYLSLYERIAAKPAGRFSTARLVARVSKTWQNHLITEQAWLPIERGLRNSIMRKEGFDELRGMTLATDVISGRFDVVIPRHNLKRQLSNNPNLNFHKTTDRHGLSKAGAKYLAKLIEAKAS